VGGVVGVVRGAEVEAGVVVVTRGMREVVKAVRLTNHQRGQSDCQPWQRGQLDHMKARSDH
jgi:hypothetical protein